MSKHSMATTLTSVVAAVALFLIANYFEDDSRWEMSLSDRAGPRVSSRSYFESPVRTINAADNCEQSERDLLRLVDTARSCTNDDDCTIFDFGYPIQCLTSVAKSQITDLRLEYRRYQASCDFRVYYDCPSGHMDRRPVCRSNQCSVDLTGTDELKDETLDYLRIE